MLDDGRIWIQIREAQNFGSGTLIIMNHSYNNLSADFTSVRVWGSQSLHPDSYSTNFSLTVHLKQRRLSNFVSQFLRGITPKYNTSNICRFFFYPVEELYYTKSTRVSGGVGGQHSLGGEVAGGANSNDWRERLALCLLCAPPPKL